jgi:neutral trehalase
MNELLWDEKDGMYYDRLMSGNLTGVLTPANLFTLMAGIPSKEQAEKIEMAASLISMI